MCIVGTGVAQATRNTDFRIVVTKMGKHSNNLTIGKTIAVVTEHPTAMKEAPITYGEIPSEAIEKMYRKRLCDPKVEDVINLALAMNLEQVFGEKEEALLRDETVAIRVGSTHHPKVRKMFKKHEFIWLVQLGEINVIY